MKTPLEMLKEEEDRSKIHIQRNKTTIQIKTGEFEYIMQELEGTPEEAVVAYHALKRAYTPQGGLPKKEMDAWLDTYLLSQTGDVNQYSKMSDSQKECIQAIKRSLARIKSKQEITFSADDVGPGKGEGGDWSNNVF